MQPYILSPVITTIRLTIQPDKVRSATFLIGPVVATIRPHFHHTTAHKVRRATFYFGPVVATIRPQLHHITLPKARRATFSFGPVVATIRPQLHYIRSTGQPFYLVRLLQPSDPSYITLHRVHMAITKCEAFIKLRLKWAQINELDAMRVHSSTFFRLPLQIEITQNTHLLTMGLPSNFVRTDQTAGFSQIVSLL